MQTGFLEPSPQPARANAEPGTLVIRPGCNFMPPCLASSPRPPCQACLALVGQHMVASKTYLILMHPEGHAA